jgi:hypothetical protein
MILFMTFSLKQRRFGVALDSAAATPKTNAVALLRRTVA